MEDIPFGKSRLFSAMVRDNRPAPSPVARRAPDCLLCRPVSDSPPLCPWAQYLLTTNRLFLPFPRRSPSFVFSPFPPCDTPFRHPVQSPPPPAGAPSVYVDALTFQVVPFTECLWPSGGPSGPPPPPGAVSRAAPAHPSAAPQGGSR